MTTENMIAFSSWPTWLAMASLVIVGILIILRPVRHSRPPGNMDVPIWSKKWFQFSTFLILAIAVVLILISGT